MNEATLRVTKRSTRGLFCRDEFETSTLATLLRDFYENTRDYRAFQAPSNQTLLWSHLASDLRERLPGTPDGEIRVLEVGAGRSGLAGYLQTGGLRDHVQIHAQDVTGQNTEWLERHFDSATIGSIEEVPGKFDFVLSSYVFEHVTAPRAFLDSLWSKLAPGGVILMICPRYDAPFYLPPSVDHVAAPKQMSLACYVLWRRLLTFITSRPAWLVLKDPAVFHLPFSIDRDAVHWVSWFDIRAHWPQATRLKLPSGSLSDWVAKDLLTVGFRVEKEADDVSHLSNGP
jgi:SAM-dependent methyltransferase